MSAAGWLTAGCAVVTRQHGRGDCSLAARVTVTAAGRLVTASADGATVPPAARRTQAGSS